MSDPPLRWKPPKEVRFGINAKWIAYAQDFQFGKRGLPGRVWFTVESVEANGQCRLTAPGYGGRPYGNGAIYVNWIDVAIWGRQRHDDAA
jgi:hypothetical protein